MAGVGEMITGRGARKQRSLAEYAQNEQASRLSAEARRLDTIERGQRGNAARGGGGLLAFVDEFSKGKLKETLG